MDIFRLRTSAALVISLLACADSRAKSAERGTSEGPALVLDTVEVNAARANSWWTDSILAERSHATPELRESAALMRRSRLIETQELLARLGYGNLISGEVDTPTLRAMRLFQHRHGLPASDDFDS